MTALPLLCLVAVASYLVGAIPFGYLIARWRGHDIRREGSGNIGATNVGRVLGLRWGLLVVALDFGKGAVPVALARLIPTPTDSNLLPDTLPVLAGIAAFVGHLLPIYLRFRGGKGVATGCGVIAVLLPLSDPIFGALITLIVLLAWGLTLALTRYVAVASIMAAALLFVLRLCITSEPWSNEHVVVTTFCALGALLVLVRHQSNLRRLRQGTEPRLGK
jgi:glycerol-3-phosphate acyltransferase PlsY